MPIRSTPPDTLLELARLRALERRVRALLDVRGAITRAALRSALTSTTKD